MPGAGAGSRLDPGVGPCLPPGRPVGSCQCRSGLRLLKAPLLPTAPWGTNPEWQVRTEMGGGSQNVKKSKFLLRLGNKILSKIQWEQKK